MTKEVKRLISEIKYWGRLARRMRKAGQGDKQAIGMVKKYAYLLKNELVRG
jgi:hypothetical protein